MISAPKMASLASVEYAPIAVLALTAMALVAAMILAAQLIGPRRHGPIKDSPYEAGMVPAGSPRRRFRVAYYLIAVMFLVFDVEIVLLYPWALVFPRPAGDTPAGQMAAALRASGYGPGFFLAAFGIFFALLAIGLIYEWRKGVLRWE
jgi:NADH-quinone oxidoreductase subunit A